MRKLFILLLLLVNISLKAQLYPPYLSSPADNAYQQKFILPISWSKDTKATAYHYQVDTSANFNSPLLREDTITALTDTLKNLKEYTQYYWRVRSLDATTASSWSFARNFRTNYLSAIGGYPNSYISGKIRLNGIGLDMRMQLDTSADFNSPLLYETAVEDDGGYYVYGQTPVMLFEQKYYARCKVDDGDYVTDWQEYASNFTTPARTPSTGYPDNSTLSNDFKLSIQMVNYYLNPKPDTIYYEVLIDTSADFSSGILKTFYTDNYLFKPNTDFLLQGKKYFWKYRVVSVIDTSNWSKNFTFSTPNRVSLLYPHPSYYNNIDSNGYVYFEFFDNALYVEYEYDTTLDFNSPLLIKDTMTNVANGRVMKYYDPFFYKKNQYFRYRIYSSNDTSDWILSYLRFNNSITLTNPSNGTFFYDVNPTFSWYKIGNSNYQVQIDTNNKFDSPLLINFFKDSSSLISDDLYFGKPHYWRVRAVTKRDSSDWSAVRYFSTREKISLSSPYDQRIDVLATDQIEAFPIRGTDNYEIRLSEDSTFASYQSLVLADKPGQIVYTKISNFVTEYGKSYFWTVIGTHTRDTAYSDVWKFTMKKEDPTPPKVILVSPTDKYKDLPYTLYDITFDWQDNTFTTQYELEYSTSVNFSANVISKTAGISEIKLNDFAPGTTYYWRVRSKNITKTGPWSDVWSFSMIGQLTIPVNLSPDNKSNVPVNVTLNWEDVPAALSYDFRIGNDIYLTTAPIYNTPVSEAKITNLTPNKTYYWQVRSRNQYYMTGWGFTAVFVTGTSLNVNNETKINFIVYPNPSHDNSCEISGGNLLNADVRLFDMKGSEMAIQKNMISNEKMRINSDAILHGIYILEVKTEEGVDRIRLMFE